MPTHTNASRRVARPQVSPQYAARPAPRKFWKPENVLVIALAAALVIAIYALAKNNSRVNEVQFESQETTVSPPVEEKNPVPVRSHAARSAYVAQAVAQPRRPDVRAASDGSGKVVLPDDVAGHCSIGQDAIKDLGECLIRNGARVK